MMLSMCVCAGYVLHMAHAVAPTRSAAGMCDVQSLKRDMHIAHTATPTPLTLTSMWSGATVAAHRTTARGACS